MTKSLSKWDEGDLVRFSFANGTAIEGYVRFSDTGELWLDCGIGPFANVLGPWFNAPDSPLRGLTPTLLVAAPPLIKSTDPVIQAVAQALLGEEATTTSGYYGASYRIDAEHAWDLAEIAVDVVRAIGVRP
jgi:hypothetical protein